MVPDGASVIRHPINCLEILRCRFDRADLGAVSDTGYFTHSGDQDDMFAFMEQPERKRGQAH